MTLTLFLLLVALGSISWLFFDMLYITDIKHKARMHHRYQMFNEYKRPKNRIGQGIWDRAIRREKKLERQRKVDRILDIHK